MKTPWPTLSPICFIPMSPRFVIALDAESLLGKMEDIYAGVRDYELNVGVPDSAFELERE